MRKFYGFLVKEFYHIFRDYRTLLILFGMPVVQILLFGYAITNEIRDAKIAILDLSKDNVTQEITNKIMSSGYYILYSNLTSSEDIERIFQGGKVKQVIIFEDHFAENLKKQGKASVQLISDASDPNTGTTLLNYTISIIYAYQKEFNKKAAIPMKINTETKMYYNEELKGVYLFVPGLITILLMLVSAMMTSISITKEKELGTMEVLLASPMHPMQVILGKVAPYMLLSFINSIVILLLGYFVFEVPLRGSLALLLGESLLFILTALALGIFISTVAASQQVALMISLVGLMMPTILLSGFIFPIENMPTALQYLTYCIPATWFIRIVRGIMLKGADLATLWDETAIIAGFAVLFILLSFKKYKIRLE